MMHCRNFISGLLFLSLMLLMMATKEVSAAPHQLEDRRSPETESGKRSLSFYFVNALSYSSTKRKPKAINLASFSFSVVPRLLSKPINPPKTWTQQTPYITNPAPLLGDARISITPRSTPALPAASPGRVLGTRCIYPLGMWADAVGGTSKNGSKGVESTGRYGGKCPGVFDCMGCR